MFPFSTFPTCQFSPALEKKTIRVSPEVWPPSPEEEACEEEEVLLALGLLCALDERLLAPVEEQPTSRQQARGRNKVLFIFLIRRGEHLQMGLLLG